MHEFENLEKKVQQVEKPLPLVLEIKPGQSKKGLVEMFQPGTYEGMTTEQLVYKMLEEERSIEERELADRITTGMSGGQLLYKGEDLKEKKPLAYAVTETTGAGEPYLYLSIKQIKPQEGGLVWNYS